MSPTRPLDHLIRPRLQRLLDDLGEQVGADLYRRVLEEVERILIEEVLARVGGKRKRAAAMLGIHRNTLRQRMERLRIRTSSPVSSDAKPEDPFV